MTAEVVLGNQKVPSGGWPEGVKVAQIRQDAWSCESLHPSAGGIEQSSQPMSNAALSREPRGRALAISCHTPART